MYFLYFFPDVSVQLVLIMLVVVVCHDQVRRQVS